MHISKAWPLRYLRYRCQHGHRYKEELWSVLGRAREVGSRGGWHHCGPGTLSKDRERKEPETITRLQERVGLKFPRLGLGTCAVSGETGKKKKSNQKNPAVQKLLGCHSLSQGFGLLLVCLQRP